MRCPLFILIGLANFISFCSGEFMAIWTCMPLVIFLHQKYLIVLVWRCADFHTTTVLPNFHVWYTRVQYPWPKSNPNARVLFDEVQLDTQIILYPRRCNTRYAPIDTGFPSPLPPSVGPPEPVVTPACEQPCTIIEFGNISPSVICFSEGGYPPTSASCCAHSYPSVMCKFTSIPFIL